MGGFFVNSPSELGSAFMVDPEKKRQEEEEARRNDPTVRIKAIEAYTATRPGSLERSLAAQQLHALGVPLPVEIGPNGPSANNYTPPTPAPRRPPAPAPPPSTTGPAADIEPPAVPGRIVRGPNGEVMLTNLADAGKPLGLVEAKGKVAAGGPMRFTSDAGQVATLNPGGGGGYMYGGDIPSMNLSAAQVMDDKNLNPGQQQIWMDRKNEEFEMAMKQAAIEKLKAESYGLNAQGGLFGEQTAGLKKTREMTPEQRGYEASTLPLLDHVTKNVDRYAALIGPKVDNIYMAMLAADPKMAAQAAKNPAAKQQMREAAKAAAIQQFVQENQRQLMQELIRSGAYQSGLS